MDIVFEKYKHTFDQFVSLSHFEWALFKSKTKVHHYQKGEIIHHAGEINNQLFFHQCFLQGGA